LAVLAKASNALPKNDSSWYFYKHLGIRCSHNPIQSVRGWFQRHDLGKKATLFHCGVPYQSVAIRSSSKKSKQDRAVDEIDRQRYTDD
jgi:hypothetical protein